MIISELKIMILQSGYSMSLSVYMKEIMSVDRRNHELITCSAIPLFKFVKP